METMVERGEWHDVIDPIAKRFELAATLGQGTSWNAEGSAAVAKILRKMAGIIDTEIAKREDDAALSEQSQKVVDHER